MSTSDWISLGSAVATFLGVVVALVAVWLQLRKMNQQLTIQHFADYTKRYQEIILRFPEDINTPSFQVSGHANYESLMRCMRAYFDLSFEEWYLNERNLIDPCIWSIWRGGMQAAMSKAAFQQAWAIVRDDTQFGPAFEAYLDGFRLVHLYVQRGIAGQHFPSSGRLARRSRDAPTSAAHLFTRAPSLRAGRRAVVDEPQR